MPKISESKGRPDENSGYTRLFGNQQLGQLLSRVQAAVIRSGNDLEKVVKNETSDKLKTSLDDILGGQHSFSNIEVVFQARMPAQASLRGETADIVHFDHTQKIAKIIELKDGDTFDTKKASGELASMEIFAKWLASRIDYKVNYYFCSFNQINKDAIVQGAKGRFDISHAMTGRELCNLLNIDYEAIRIKRQSDQPENLRYFISELLRIEEVKQIIKDLMEKVK